MSAQKGSELLIKIGDDASPEVFTALAGLRTKSLTINAEQVDITNSDSVQKWRELLPGAGVKSMAVSGSGVFLDAAVDQTLITEVMAQTHRDFQIVVPGLGTFEGRFQIAQWQLAGEHNAEVTYDVTLESGAIIAYTAS